MFLIRVGIIDFFVKVDIPQIHYNPISTFIKEIICQVTGGLLDFSL